MPDFSHVSRSAPSARTADIRIDGIEGMRPVLTCKPATQRNAPYLNALLRRTRVRRQGRIKMTAEMLKENRDQDRELIAKHCVESWTGVVDKEGNEVPFSVDNCMDFFRALPDELFDDFRADCSEEDLFREETEDTAGN